MPSLFPFSPRALILDMDGLLVDSEPLWFEVERDFVRQRGGATFTVELGQRCLGRGLVATLRLIEVECGIAIDEVADCQWVIDTFIARAGQLALKPGARELLAAAYGRVPMALASSSSLRLISAVVDRFDLRPFLSVVVSGESVAHPKPAPDIFIEAANSLGVAGGECAVLEDSPVGAAAGRAAGMVVIAVPEGTPSGRGFERFADAVVADLVAARGLLRFGE